MKGALLVPSLEKFDSVVVYETPQRFLVVGSMGGDEYHMVKVERSDPYTLQLVEDCHMYSSRDLQGVLAMAGAKHTCSGVGLLGFVRFVQGWYMLVMVERRHVAHIGQHAVYAIEDTAVLPLGPLPKDDHELTKADEARYKRLFFGIDLSSFYFSYTYNLTRTLQHGMCTQDTSPDAKFCWNWYLGAPIREQLSAKWFVPVIQGYAASVTYAAYFDHCIRFTLISRRSQYYAGTRYLKRGMSDAGHVANDVETEQIVQELRPASDREYPHFSSFVQVRGSIPLYWSQENTFAIPKPDVTVYRSDPFQNSAIKHFQDLFARYGAPVVILNLIKHHEKRPRETILLDGFTEVVDTINASLPPELHLVYIPWDFHSHTKKAEVAGSLVPIARETMKKTGFFHTGTQNGKPLQPFEVNRNNRRDQEQQEAEGPDGDWVGQDLRQCRGRVQKGILRSNCVDCLDRTNASQFCIGIAALGEQLYAMGLAASPVLEFRAKLVTVVLKLYEDMGDAIAVQYAGSLLAHRMNSYAANNVASKWGVVSKDLMTSIRRYYTSTFTDAEKQSSINLFLGRFRPYENPAYEPLWSLVSDAALHCPPTPDEHRRPLWTTKWWEVPLRTYQETLNRAANRVYFDGSLGAAMAVAVRKKTPQPKVVDFVYRMDVSEAFKMTYEPWQLTSYDETFSKPFLQIFRAVEALASEDDAAKGNALSTVTTAGGVKKKGAAPEYAKYLGAFANWVQGEVTRHLMPPTTASIRQGRGGKGGGFGAATSSSGSGMMGSQGIGGGKGDPNAATAAAAKGGDASSSLLDTVSVNQASLDKYGTYVKFCAESVWDKRDFERKRLESYLTKCTDTGLVAVSPDFLPSQSFYSAYLLDAETFSFSSGEPPLGKKLYEDYLGEQEAMQDESISQMSVDEYPLLFVDSAAKVGSRRVPRKW